MSWPLGWNVLVFTLFQVGVNVAYKWGTLDDGRRWWWGWALGSALNAASVFFITRAYTLAPGQTNYVFTACIGLNFCAVSAALWFLFRDRLMPWQWVAMGLVLAGVVLFGLAARPEEASRPGTGGPDRSGMEEEP